MTRDKFGRFCSTKKRIAYLATTDSWDLTVKRIQEKLFEIIDSVNSLLEEKEDGEATACLGDHISMKYYNSSYIFCPYCKFKL